MPNKAFRMLSARSMRSVEPVLDDALSGWHFLPPVSFIQLPAQFRTLYERRGQREGVFRADCAFEVLYLSAIGALTSLIVLAARFTKLRDQLDITSPSAADLSEQVVRLLLDGAMRPDARWASL
jgi:hypothetical protein